MVVACPTCGAPGRLTPGDAVDRCRHCRAALVATAPIMGHGVAAAQTAWRAAAVERYRAQRRNLRADPFGAALGESMLALLPLVLAWPLLVQAGVHSRQLIRGGGHVATTAALWCGVLVLVAAGVGLWWRRSNAGRSRRAALQELTRQHRGRVLHGIRAALDWLDQHWAGPYDHAHVRKGGYDAAALTIGAYPALFECAPGASERLPARVQLLVAAWVPGASEGTGARLGPAVGPLAQALAHAGWLATFQEGGVVLQLADHLTPRWKDPRMLAQAGPLLQTVPALLEAAGCRPPPPLPAVGRA